MEYPTWLNPADNAWQLTAATLVGLMSVPGLVVLYGGVMQKRWSVNSMMLTFIAFAVVLVLWVLYGYNMAFGQPVHVFGSSTSFFSTFIGHPSSVLSSHDLEKQGNIPLIGDVAFPQSTLVYFQLVFAAITPLLMLGSVLGRVNFKAWVVFVALWSSLIYTVNAFLIWGGGYFGHHGVLDFSGGYVIHLAAGVSGFVAAWVIGPRLARDREIDAPNNLAMVAIGAGLLWLGWNGFNGGDPYNIGFDSSAAVLNTNICAAVAFLVWVGCDYATKRKPSLLGSVNGIIVGLVAITPAAGFVNGWGAIIIGVVASILVYVAYNYVALLRPFRNVDDTLGVIYTHGFAGVIGGLLTGLLATSAMKLSPTTVVARRRLAPAQVAVPRRGLGHPVLRGRHVHPAQARGPRDPAAHERGGHGDGRSRRARSRGVPLGHPVARVPVRLPAPGRRGAGRRTAGVDTACGRHGSATLP